MVNHTKGDDRHRAQRRRLDDRTSVGGGNGGGFAGLCRRPPSKRAHRQQGSGSEWRSYPRSLCTHCRGPNGLWPEWVLAQTDIEQTVLAQTFMGEVVNPEDDGAAKFRYGLNSALGRPSERLFGSDGSGTQILRGADDGVGKLPGKSYRFPNVRAGTPLRFRTDRRTQFLAAIGLRCSSRTNSGDPMSVSAPIIDIAPKSSTSVRCRSLP